MKKGVRSLTEICRKARVCPEWISLAESNPWFYEFLQDRLKRRGDPGFDIGDEDSGS